MPHTEDVDPRDRVFAAAVTSAYTAGLSAGELHALVTDLDPGAEWDQLYDNADPGWHECNPQAPVAEVPPR